MKQRNASSGVQTINAAGAVRAAGLPRVALQLPPGKALQVAGHMSGEAVVEHASRYRETQIDVAWGARIVEL
jgi:hypothetical protein